MISMDLPRRFPTTSGSGNKYIFILLDYDSDYIKATPLSSKTKEEMVCCFKLCYNEFKQAGFTAQLLKLDNEVSKELIKAIKVEDLDYQLVAPHENNLNPIECAIQTFKNHFIFVLASTDPKFPKNRWNLLLPHAEVTLNTSQPSCINPPICAYTQIYGKFDFDTTPLAPTGCKMMVHDSTNE